MAACNSPKKTEFVLDAEQNGETDPYLIVKNDMSSFMEDIRSVSRTQRKEVYLSFGHVQWPSSFIQLVDEQLDEEEVKTLSTYNFDGRGKAFRPLLIILTARCIHAHLGKE